MSNAPIYISAFSRISLRPTNYGDNFPPVDILFTKEEALDWLEEQTGSKYDSAFFDRLFEVAGRHIGPMYTLKFLVEASDVSSFPYL